MDEITIGDKTYISAKRAAEITGYARDYVGQLCREGHVDAKMVGRSWYVYEPAIRAHRFGPEAAQEAPKEVLDEESKAPAAAEASAPEANTAWERPTYTAEKPEMLPELEAPRLEELLPPAEETLTDMQAAWREWFEQRQTQLETPEIESPEVIDERNEAEEVSIPLHHLEEKQEIEEKEEEIVPIRPIQPMSEPVATPERAYHVDIARAPAQIHPISMANSTPAVLNTRYSAEPIAAAGQGKIVSERIVRAQQPGSRKKKAVRKGRSSNAPVVAALVGISLVSVTIAVIGTGYANRYLKTLPAEKNPAIKFLVGTREFSRP